jgi:predicted ATPase
VLPLVGRQRELASCVTLLDEAVDGRGSVVALSGEAGIGKSRLARELLAIARARGLRTLSGTACPYQGGLSYAPMLEALRPLVATDNPARARLVDGLADLGRLFAGLPLPPPTSLGDPSLERTRLFEAVARML